MSYIKINLMMVIVNIFICIFPIIITIKQQHIIDVIEQAIGFLPLSLSIYELTSNLLNKSNHQSILINIHNIYQLIITFMKYFQKSYRTLKKTQAHPTRTTHPTNLTNSHKHAQHQHQNITYKFKQRKAKISNIYSLQNLSDKLKQIYSTCKYFRIAHRVFLMAVHVLKAVYSICQNVFITSVEVLAALTLCIKFEQRGQEGLIVALIDQSKIAKSELIGAQLHIFQTLQFRLPSANCLPQIVLVLFKNWNQFIQGHLATHGFFHLDHQSHPSTQQFQNCCNILLLFDSLIIQSNFVSLSAQHCLGIALYIVFWYTASMINLQIGPYGINDIVMKFWEMSYGREAGQELMKSIDIVDIEIYFTKLRSLCLSDYEQYKQKIFTMML